MYFYIYIYIYIKWEEYNYDFCEEKDMLFSRAPKDIESTTLNCEECVSGKNTVKISVEKKGEQQR